MADSPLDLSELVLHYERTVATREGELFSATKSVLDGLMTYASDGGLRERGNDERTCQHWYTRLAAALTGYLIDPATQINHVQLSYLCRRKQVLVSIYAASGYRSMKHLIRLMGNENSGQITFSGERVIVLLAVIGLDDVTDELLGLAIRQPPDIFLTLLLGWLCQRSVLTAEGERNRAALISAAERCRELLITDGALEPIAHAWMYASYADCAQKHDVKLTLNELLLRRMQHDGIEESSVQYMRRPKPKMLVIHERFRVEHAMYRCYAPSISQLGNHFRLVALADESNIDSAADSLFEQVIKLPEKIPSIAEIAAIVKSVEPDIIYYPSIGMSHWTIMLAGLRLAPVQVMSHGHPATTMWPTIDYAYVSELEGDISALHSEKLLVGNLLADFSPHSDMPEVMPELPEPSLREVRVAVNSKVMKLSYRLIEICKRLQREASYPVKFIFFPGERHVFYDGLVAAIQGFLPNAEVMRYTSYQAFLTQLAQCDLALASFPFGNTNSTVDTCLLGLPTVAHFGPESPAQSDRLVIETAGLAEWLVCRSDEQYFKTALALINHPERRQQALNGLSREQIRNNLFADAVTDRFNPMPEVFYKAYQNHNELAASSARVFRYDQILAM